MEKELQIVQIKIQVTKKYIIFLKFLVNLIDIVCKIHYHEDIDDRQCFSMFYLYVIYIEKEIAEIGKTKIILKNI